MIEVRFQAGTVTIRDGKWKGPSDLTQVLQPETDRRRKEYYLYDPDPDLTDALWVANLGDGQVVDQRERS